MPCTCPLDAYPPPPGKIDPLTDKPDRRPVWSAKDSYQGAVPFRLPCGKCLACRLDRAREWSMRIMHEASLYDTNLFLTLTYAPQHLPAGGALRIGDLQRFMKRVRWHFQPRTIRFFACGEYGEKGDRPHYHVILFDAWFPDRVLWKVTDLGEHLFRSAMLEQLWPVGHALFGDVTHESAGYVARYAIKKVNGPLAADHYRRTAIVPETGEVREWTVPPEFAVMSRRPGIGNLWYQRYAGDCFPSDFLVVDGQKVPVPRYYKAQLPEGEQRVVSARRKANAKRHADNNTEARLITRHESQALRAKRLERSFEREEL